MQIARLREVTFASGIGAKEKKNHEEMVVMVVTVTIMTMMTASLDPLGTLLGY